MSETDGFYLDRRGQHELVGILVCIPELVEDLSVTLTGQARISRGDMGKPRRRKRDSALPLHLGAAEASAALHNCLSTWARAVCEQRALDYDGTDDIVGLARWLRKWVIALAMTEGAEESLPDIRAHIKACLRVVDIPLDDYVLVDRARVDAANRQVLTAGQVEKVARRLGEVGQGLTKRRVETLAKQGRIHPAAVDGETRFYRLGDVLDAHKRHARNPGTPRSAT